MVADVALGSPTDALIRFTDANGSPYAGAVGAGGSMSIYGPASATTVVAGPTVVSDYGDGWYGIPVTAAQAATAGLYRGLIPTVTFSGRIFVNQEVRFTVGDVPPEYRTLRGIITEVCRALGCGLTGTTTTLGSTTTLKDTKWLDAGLATNEFVDDELLILKPVAGDTNPLRISAFDPTTGTFTFKPAIASALAAGIDYLLIRTGMKRTSYDALRSAVDAAIAELATRQRVTDEVTLTTSSTTNRYAVPSSWLGIEKVEINRVTGGTWEYWEEFQPADYEYWPDRRLLLLKRWGLGYGGYPLKLTGRVGVTPPARLGSLVRVPWPALVSTAAGVLGLTPAQQAAYRIQAGRAGALATRG